MPRAENPTVGKMLDTWGRQNRRLAEKECAACRVHFRPLRASSRFCSRPCAWSQNGGQNRTAESWWTNAKGYIVGRVWVGGERRNVPQHRFIMERHLGRRLEAYEDVHHINGVKSDNRLENLQVIGHGEHTRLTHAGRPRAKGVRLNLSAQERAARSERMKVMRRAAIASARGEG